MAAHNKKEFRGWSHSHKPVHPHAPAGGSGNGRSRFPGPTSGYVHDKIPHPDSPAGRHADWGNILLSVGIHLPSMGKSLLLALLPKYKKVNKPFSSALMQHYVQGSGEPYDLKEVGPIPDEWQVFIEKETSGIPNEYDLSAYKPKPLMTDFKNSLGHFHVKVTAKVGSNLKVYEITKDYHFGFKPDDVDRQGQHGLELDGMSYDDVKELKDWLPTTKYQNPGGFSEGFEIKQVRGVWTLFIPQELLVHSGKPFQVTGQFTR